MKIMADIFRDNLNSIFGEIVLRLTEKESRYLKFIYRRQEEESEKIKTGDLAEYLKVEPSTVTETLQNLSEKKLLQYRSYRGVDITKKGEEKAKELLRKHRILEFLFVNHLNLNTEKACREAVKLDYHATEELINSICRTFEHPETCPCGKKIFENKTCSQR